MYLIFDSNINHYGLHLDNFKGDFLNILIFCTLRFQIFKKLYLGQILLYPNKPYINGKMYIDDVENLNFKKWTLMNGLWSRVT